MQTNMRTKNMNAVWTSSTYDAPDAKALFLAGDFNEWSATAKAMKPSSETRGAWHSRFRPAREFKSVVDGVWCCEPGVDRGEQGSHECIETVWTMNRVVQVFSA